MAAQTYALPSTQNITRVELENGMMVLVYENHSAQSVVVQGSLRTGSIYEDDPAKAGLASMTISSLMRGTSARDFDTVYATLEDIGADLDLSSSNHVTAFGGKSLAEDLPVVIDVLNDVLRNPIFPEEQVERLRGERMTYLQYAMQDTRYRAGRLFRQNLYPDSHPYHHSDYGTMETLPNITVDDLKAFHAKHLGPRNMIITVVGAVKADDAVQIVRDKLEDWTNSDQPAELSLPEIEAPAETRRAFVPIPGKTQSDIVMGSIGPSRYDDDFVPAVIANSVLGEFGMMGRIGYEIREKRGLAYYAYSRVEGGAGPGAWSISAGVAPQNVDLAIEQALEQAKRLGEEPVSDEDLSDNKSYYTGRLPLQLESNGGIATQIHRMERYGLGLDYLLQYHDMIHSLTKEQLQDAAAKYLNPEHLVIAVAGPENDAT